MEGRCVRGRKKPARRGRKPNVSPVRTLLPRGAGWRIALYAVFRKENRTRDPLQRSQGGKQGAGLGIRGNPGHDEFAAVGAADTDKGRPMRLGPKEAGP